MVLDKIQQFTSKQSRDSLVPYKYWRKLFRGNKKNLSLNRVNINSKWLNTGIFLNSEKFMTAITIIFNFVLKSLSKEEK